MCLGSIDCGVYTTVFDTFSYRIDFRFYSLALIASGWLTLITDFLSYSG